ncbi:hypothetical protein [Lewinella sp. W8]|uniref:hypothetical protein n=1 Tax=Lewinella sp. W8 TaxID=2528208 RepID=UPI0010678656|nr:hypothetical protein [Lewinella sp. W8]MTB51260.1 hypothetical protein [Lewinella sp. W8]
MQFSILGHPVSTKYLHMVLASFQSLGICLIWFVFLTCPQIIGAQEPDFDQVITDWETAWRDSLISLDTTIIETVVGITRREGCASLNYFLGPKEPYHWAKGKDSDSIDFRRFSSGFSDALKCAIVLALIEQQQCIQEIIEKSFVKGKNCPLDEVRVGCWPIFELIVNSPDTGIRAPVKEAIRQKGFRFHFAPNPFMEHRFIRQHFSQLWIELFSPAEWEELPKSQLRYLEGLAKG